MIALAGTYTDTGLETSVIYGVTRCQALNVNRCLVIHLHTGGLANASRALRARARLQSASEEYRTTPDTDLSSHRLSRLPTRAIVRLGVREILAHLKNARAKTQFRL